MVYSQHKRRGTYRCRHIMFHVEHCQQLPSWISKQVQGIVFKRLDVVSINTCWFPGTLINLIVGSPQLWGWTSGRSEDSPLGNELLGKLEGPGYWKLIQTWYSSYGLVRHYASVSMGNLMVSRAATSIYWLYFGDVELVLIFWTMHSKVNWDGTAALRLYVSSSSLVAGEPRPIIG